MSLAVRQGEKSVREALEAQHRGVKDSHASASGRCAELEAVCKKLRTELAAVQKEKDGLAAQLASLQVVCRSELHMKFVTPTQRKSSPLAFWKGIVYVQ